MWNEVVLDNTPPEAGCSWPVIYTCAAGSELSESELAVQEWTEQMSIEILWAASGRRFGLCTSTYRPCTRSACVEGPMIDAWSLLGRGGWFTWDPWAGSIFALVNCGCVGSCECSSVEAFDLWHKRVRAVSEVIIDGVVLDPANYRLSKNRLIRTDGERWPVCQDANVAAGEVGSMTVTVVHGRPTPMGGRISAGILASELRKACQGDEDCELPRRTQSVTRAGVNVTFLDPMTFLTEGRTGLYEVDAWLHAVNPNRLQRRARVYRHDDPRRRRRTRA